MRWEIISRPHPRVVRVRCLDALLPMGETYLTRDGRRDGELHPIAEVRRQQGRNDLNKVLDVEPEFVGEIPEGDDDNPSS